MLGNCSINVAVLITILITIVTVTIIITIMTASDTLLNMSAVANELL